MSCPDCSMEDQVEVMQAKVAKWVDSIRTKCTNATNAWQFLVFSWLSHLWERPRLLCLLKPI